MFRAFDQEYAHPYFYFVFTYFLRFLYENIDSSGFIIIGMGASFVNIQLNIFVHKWEIFFFLVVFNISQALLTLFLEIFTYELTANSGLLS